MNPLVSVSGVCVCRYLDIHAVPVVNVDAIEAIEATMLFISGNYPVVLVTHVI